MNDLKHFVEFYCRGEDGLFGGSIILKFHSGTRKVEKRDRILLEDEIPVLWTTSELSIYKNGKVTKIEKEKYVSGSQITAYRFFDAESVKSKDRGDVSSAYVLGKVIPVEDIPGSDFHDRDDRVDYFKREKGLSEVIYTRSKGIEEVGSLNNAFGEGKWNLVPDKDFRFFNSSKYRPEIEIERF